MWTCPVTAFARASKTEQRDWGALIGSYLASGRPKHLLLLLDIRHAPSAEDRQMFEWVLYYGVPFTLIATKADKLSRANRIPSANKTAKLLGAPPFAIPFSADSKEGRDLVIERIGQIVSDSEKRA